MEYRTISAAPLAHVLKAIEAGTDGPDSASKLCGAHRRADIVPHEFHAPRLYLRAAPDWRPASEIDWDRLANALLVDDLSGLSEPQREAVLKLAGTRPIVDLGAAMQVNPVQIAIALLAEGRKAAWRSGWLAVCCARPLHLFWPPPGLRRRSR